MAGCGSKPGERRGGRQKGTPNKVNKYTREQLEKYRGNGKTPLQFLMDTMNRAQPMKGFSHAEWFKQRFEAAAKAAPFYHAKLVTQKVEMAGIGGGPVQHQHAGGVLLADSPVTLDAWMERYGSDLPAVDDEQEEEQGA